MSKSQNLLHVSHSNQITLIQLAHATIPLNMKKVQ